MSEHSYKVLERLRITSRMTAVLASCNHQCWEIPCSCGQKADWGEEKVQWVFGFFLVGMLNARHHPLHLKVDGRKPSDSCAR